MMWEWSLGAAAIVFLCRLIAVECSPLKEVDFGIDWSATALHHSIKCPSVYVYDTGPDFYGLYHFNYSQYITIGLNSSEFYGTQCSKEGHYRTIQFEVVRIILYRIFISKRCPLQLDPAKADIFFIPMYPGPMTAHTLLDICNKHHSHFLPPLPHLNEATAPFHFFLIGKGPQWGCREWFKLPNRSDKLLNSITRLSYGSLFKTNYPDDKKNYGEYGPFDWSKDMKKSYERHGFNDWLPPSDPYVVPHSISIPYASSIHWRAHSSVDPPWTLKARAQDRPYLISFTGRLRDCAYGGPVRAKIKEVCSSNRVDKHTCYLVNGGDDCSYTAVKAQSVFCLEPGGDSPWRKSLYESLVSGCLPIIFSVYNLHVSPMHWASFARNVSVLIDPNAFIEGRVDLIKTIRSISSTDILAKQTLLSQHAHRLHYSIDDYPNDAFEIMMKGVYHQARVRQHQQPTTIDELVGQSDPDDMTTATSTPIMAASLNETTPDWGAGSLNTTTFTTITVVTQEPIDSDVVHNSSTATIL